MTRGGSATPASGAATWPRCAPGIPDAARELIAGSWDAAGPDERVMFLSVLAGGLSPADEPLLEAALDDRAPECAAGPPYLLASAARVRSRAAHGRARPRLPAPGPGHPRHAPGRQPAGRMRCRHAAGRNSARPEAGRSQLADQAHLLLEVLARTPLRTWTDEFGRPAEQILAVPAGGWAPVLFTGWSRAAIAQRDQEWMAALINWALAGGLPGRPSGAETLRQLVRRVDPALGAPGTTASQLADCCRPSVTRSGCCAFATTC